VRKPKSVLREGPSVPGDRKPVEPEDARSATVKRGSSSLLSTEYPSRVSAKTMTAYGGTVPRPGTAL